MTVTPINIRYRGFDLGFALGLHGYLPAWRSSLESDWRISTVYASGRHDVETLARQCIDFQYRADAMEVSLGRRPTMEELKP